VPWQPEVYSIAERYYRAIQICEGDGIHPLSFGLYSIINTANRNVELKVLAVVVAAESLIEAAFPQIVVEPEAFISDVASLRTNKRYWHINGSAQGETRRSPQRNAEVQELGPNSGVHRKLWV
jgi:hypothetical protein